MRKEQIVGRLLAEGHISAEEAITLLEPVGTTGRNEYRMIWDENIGGDHFEHCSCNPKNGGNGICFCTLGNRYTWM